jgi:capsular exopolysaccharide synthesis family protein
MSTNNNSIIDSKDLLQVWKVFIHNWYFIIFLPLIAAAGAYLYTYKMPDIYAGRTQILIKSAETYDYQSQLYKGLGYYGYYEDISNQKRVITSYNLIEKTIDRLNLDVSYLIVGRLKTTEVYESQPFSVIVKHVNSQLYGKPINLKIIDEDSFRLTFEKNDEKISVVHQFNTDIEESNYYLRINKIGGNFYSASSLKELDYQFVIHNKNTLVRKYKNALSVENIEYTSILQLTLEDEIPARAVTFLDTLSRVYIDYTLQSKIDVNENTINYIDKQLKEAMDMMNEIENDMEAYRTQKSILNLSKEENEYFTKLIGYDNQKRSLELQIKSLSSLEEYILKTEYNKDEHLLPPAIFMQENDQFLEKNINELYSMQISRNNLLFSATEGSASIKLLDDKMQLLRKDLLQYISNARKAIISKIKDIQEQILYYENIIRKVPGTQRDMLNIDRKLQVNEKMYLYLLEKRANAVIARAGIIPETRTIESARSIGRVKPNREKFLYSAMLGGLIFSLIISFLRLILFKKIENAEDLKEITKIPVFGEILFSEEAQENYIISEINPKAPITESFRAVRANLEFLVSQNNSKVVLITSYNPNEGKTFCSINLAVILAKAGKKVLLLELDLHKPKVHKGLELTAEKGISNVLSGKEKVEDIVINTRTENLDVMLCGPIPPNASELILSNQLEEIITYGRNNYDYVLIDTPPTGLITDAIVLMKHADATLFVLNTEFAKKEYVAISEEMAEANKLKNFGFLLNGVKIKKSRYYYNYNYGYKYGYKYGYGKN